MRPFRLGLFILAALAILAAGVFLIGDKQFMFSKTYTVSTSFKNVGGLVDGAAVRVGGIPRGAVTRIELPREPGSEMAVFLKLERSTRDVIRQDSVASIQTEGLLGEKYIEITFGSPDSPSVENGAHLAGETTMDMADVMKKTNDMMDDVQATAGQLKEISNKINQGAGTMGALVNDRRLYDQLNGATAQAQQGATAFQENMTALKHNFLLRGFFNRRGYEDSSKLTENEIADLPDTPYLRKFVYDGRKLFEAADSARLKGNPKLLDDAGRDLQGNPFGLAIVVARHGMKGDASDVLVLSQARAMNVRDYLVQHFRMDDTRFKTLAVGKDAEGPDDGQIEILVYPTGLKIPPQPPPNKTGRGGK